MDSAAHKIKFYIPPSTPSPFCPTLKVEDETPLSAWKKLENDFY
jgi:hypothetical protein